MHLLRCLAFFAAKHSLWFSAEHLPGVCNQRVDALSRNRMANSLSTGHRHPRSNRPTKNSGGTSGHTRGMDIRELDPAVQRFYHAALTDSTKKTYKAGKKRYVDFCTKFNVQPLPVSESGLCYFAAHLGEQGLMESSVKIYLSAIRQWQISEGLPDPHTAAMPLLKQIMKGVKVVRGKEGKTGKKKLPITPSILRQLAKARGGLDGAMFWAACCLAFFGFLRAGEFTVPSLKAYDTTRHLNVEDLSADHPSRPTALHVRIKVSKTDPFHRGTTVVLGTTGADLCPL